MVEIKKNKFFLIGFVLISGLFFIRCASSEKLPPEKEAEKPAGENVSIQKENEARIAVQEKEIQKILGQMTVEQKICQMIMPSIYKRPNSYEASVVKVSPQIKNALAKYNFGGIILFKANVSSTSQILTLIHDLQSAATSENSLTKIPLFIGIDQEGGNIIRLNNSCWMPGNMLVGASGDPSVSEQYASLVGSELSAIGVNMNFAPCADVNCNPANPIIGLRSFSSNPNLAAKMVEGSVKGYKNSGVISALKHFPGHGDTSTDSHEGLPRIDKTFDELKAMELVPFERGIKSGADVIMTSHIQFPKIETGTYRSISTGRNVSLPATLSKEMISGVLREKLGFDGIVITDAMDMGAVTQHFKKLDAAKLAINAGVDILLMSCDISSESEIRYSAQLISSLVSAVESGEISEQRIDESVKRILRVKYKYGILAWHDDLQNSLENAKRFVGSIENHKKEWSITEKGMTVVKNENKILPISIEENQRVGILYPYSTETTSVKYALDVVKQKFKKDLDVTLLSYTGKSFYSLSPQISKMDVTVIVTELSKPSQFNQFFDSSSAFSFVRKVIDNQHKLGKKVVLISAELPYDIAAYSDSDAIIAAYGSFEMKKPPVEDASQNVGYGPNIPVAIAATFGAASPKGKLPVDIYALNKNFKYTDEIVFPIGTGTEY